MPNTQCSKVLPRSISPLKLVARGTTLDGIVLPDHLPRLSAAVNTANAPVSVCLHFSCDEGGRKIAQGEIKTQVELLCQRCIKPMDYDIVAKVSLTLIEDEKYVDSIPDGFDPWIINQQDGDLYEIVEEEILLALPIISFHKPEQCTGTSNYATGEENSTKIPNPFDVLQELIVDR